ncbi:MAG: MCE family protein [Phycisphaerae bacterium]|nr:MCE family protein [Phycisphaerae bacterium]
MRFTSETDSLARRTGTGVIAFLATALVATLLITGIEWRRFETWEVYGTFESGLSGLKAGSVVRVGGAVMGQVTRIEIDRDHASRAHGDEPPDPTLAPSTGGFVVTFELAAEVELRQDARIVLDQNALSGLAEIDVVSVGGGRSAPIPGPLPPSAQRAPRADPFRPLRLVTRADAARRILGADGANDLRVIRAAFPGVEAIFLESTGTLEVPTGEYWGPVRESRITALLDAVDPLRRRIADDRDAWGPRLDSIREQWNTLSSTLELARDETPAPHRKAAPLDRLEQLRGAFDDRSGLRAIWRQLSAAFTAPSSSFDAIKQCLGPSFDQASLIADIVRRLWPRVKDDLIVMKVGFVIGVSELWIMRVPEVVTTLVRLIQPFGAADVNAITVILAANRAAESGEALREAIESGDWALVDGSSEIAPEVAGHLEHAIAPALRRYRRDLADLMRILDAAAARRE